MVHFVYDLIYIK